MNTTFKKAGVMGVLSLAAFGIVSASAMGFGGGFGGGTLSADEIATRQTTLFSQQAGMIGATVDEVKNAWATGKSFTTLAQEKGITQEQLRTKMQTAGTEHMKTQLATLVSKGVITQAQADQRLATVQAHQTTVSGKIGGKRGGMHGGFGGGMMNGFGF
jgi:hypothetical protein